MRKITNLNTFSEDSDDKDEKQVSYTVSQQQHTYNRYVVRMHNPIGDASEYSTLFNLLDSVSEDDEIKLDISSPGGVLDTCILIRRAIKDCSAPVLCRIGPTCASAAGAIALACDGWEVEDMSTMLVHTGSLALGFGKVNDIHAASTHNYQQIERFVRDTYEDFLTEDEIGQVLDGKEMYLRAEDLEDRLQRMATAREESYRFEQEEADLESEDFTSCDAEDVEEQ